MLGCARTVEPPDADGIGRRGGGAIQRRFYDRIGLADMWNLAGGVEEMRDKRKGVWY